MGGLEIHPGAWVDITQQLFAELLPKRRRSGALTSPKIDGSNILPAITSRYCVKRHVCAWHLPGVCRGRV